MKRTAVRPELVHSSGAPIGETYARARSALEKYADHSSAFLALNSGNEFFSARGEEGFIAYRRAGRYLLQFGGVFAPEDRRRALLADFRQFARVARCRIVGVQLQSADARLFHAEGFTVNQVGASYSLDISDFSLRGTKFVKLRNKISRAERSGLRVREAPLATYARQLAQIDRAWLRAKGRHVKEIEFLVGQLGGSGQRHRRLFVGLLDGAPVAYISYSPAYGSRPGWLHDLSRRLPEVPPGVMEALNSTALQTFRQEGAGWLHFGFTPFTGLDARHELPGHSPWTARFMRLMAERGGAVYPARSQLAYKQKWGAHEVLPDYLAFEGKPSAGAVWKILRVTRSL